MTKEPKLPHKLKWGRQDGRKGRRSGIPYRYQISGLHEPKRRDYSRGTRKCGRRGGRVEHARRLKERRQWRRVYEEAASRGILQVYKA